MVAGEGFEPTTSGLSFRGSAFESPLAVPEKCFGLAPFLAFFDRCGSAPLLVSAPGGAKGRFPNEPARRPHNPERSTYLPIKNLSPPNGELRFLVAGEGFEPTTSGL